MINLHENVAILIDGDNVDSSYMDQALKISEYYGQLKICRAYGDWEKTNLSTKYETVKALNIEDIQVDRVGKNATDHWLMMEVGEILGAELFGISVNIFIIVSGDGDFASACEFLQARGKEVIVIGNKNKFSNSLKENYEHYYLEDLNEKLSKLAELHPIPPGMVREFFRLLFHAYARLLTDKKYDWVSYSQLGAKLHEIVPDYKSKFGKYPLSEWLSNFDNEFECHEQMIRRIDTAPEMTRLGLIYKAYLQTQLGDRSHLGEFGKALRKLDPDYESRFGSKKTLRMAGRLPR